MNDDLTPAEASEETGLSEQTLANYRWRGIGPPFRKVGRTVSYPRVPLREWLDHQIVKPAS